jgi:hypothetical protein
MMQYIGPMIIKQTLKCIMDTVPYAPLGYTFTKTTFSSALASLKIGFSPDNNKYLMKLLAIICF